MPSGKALTVDHFDAQFAKGLEDIVGATHKTSHTMVTWPSGWLLERSQRFSATLTYQEKQKPSTLLVPLDGSQAVNVPTSLRKFNAKYLPQDITCPTVNLLRKWYHTFLMEMTSTHRTLLEVKQRVDAHSAATGLKHHVLRDHAADARLAAVLVQHVLGKTVPWPADVLLDDISVRAKGLLHTTWTSHVFGDDVLPEGEGEDEDDLALEWWDGGHVCGIAPPQDATVDREVDVQDTFNDQLLKVRSREAAVSKAPQIFGC